MKLVIRQRDELDALLPSLLSELGYTVLSRPTRGNRQFGVDVAALGTEDGVTKLFLFSIKQGDLTRKDWDGSDQALRPSINEILDVYIPTRILAEHRSLPIVICLCFGGEIVEGMRQTVTGFTDRLTTDRLSFQEWNGDKIAKLISNGPLRQELLPREHRSSFQKAVAMVDEPELAFEHFAALIDGLAVEGTSAQRVQRARQIYLCLWVLFVWARDANNVEAAYLAAERAILRVWGLSHAEIGKSTNAAEDLGVVIFELVDLYDLIWDELFARKILPHVGARNAISIAVGTSSPVDVNLKLFDIIGRLALRGLWLMWREGQDIDLLSAGANWESPKIHELGGQIAQLIENNPALFTPISEHQAADIALALTFLRAHGGCNQVVQVWR